MTNTVKPIPDGYHTITPSLTCKNAARAIEFYKQAFEAQERARMTTPNGKIGHAELKIGDSNFMLNDEFPQMGVSAPTSPGGSYLFLYVKDVDTTFKSAVSAGARVDLPVADQFGEIATASLPILSATNGGSPHIPKTCHPRKWSGAARNTQRKWQPDKNSYRQRQAHDQLVNRVGGGRRGGRSCPLVPTSH